MRERVRWIDTAKFLGIFAIYLGHFGEKAGNSYNFVFQYHVALFFCLSGCMDTYDQENNIMRYTLKEIKSKLVPLWVFSVLSIVVCVIQNNYGLGRISDFLILVAKGNIRESFFAASLWFFSCLFFMKIIFKLIKFLKKSWLIFAVCLAMYMIAELVITPRPSIKPHWFYNLDSVFYYIIFFAIGYIGYPYIVDLFKLDTRLKKVIFILSGGICFGYSALIFNGRDGLTPVIILFPALRLFIPIIRALLIIWFNLIIAKIVENINIFNEIGRNTLYLCGNEYIVKILVPCMIELTGLELNLSSPLSAYLYTTILLIVCIKILIPSEKRLLYSTMDILKSVKV